MTALIIIRAIIVGVICYIVDEGMVFITAGMGGGCGTGTAPVVAQAAKNMGILTVAVVTKPFAFEGRGRMKVAEAGIEELRKFTDAILVIPNNNLKHATDSKITFINAFAIAEGVLLRTVASIIDLVQSTAEINVDFADMTTVIQNSGKIHVGFCKASGADRVQEVYDSRYHYQRGESGAAERCWIGCGHGYCSFGHSRYEHDGSGYEINQGRKGQSMPV